MHGVVTQSWPVILLRVRDNGQVLTSPPLITATGGAMGSTLIVVADASLLMPSWLITTRDSV